MGFKGTKGEWNAFKLNERYVIGNEKDSTLHFIDCWLKGIGGIKSNEEAKANSLLISKAPEMLKMLKTFVDDFDFINEGGNYNYNIEQARKLIKEATEF